MITKIYGLYKLILYLMIPDWELTSPLTGDIMKLQGHLTNRPKRKV